MELCIRKAGPGEEKRVLQFYHDLIDGMKDMPYRPAWQKGVYPTLEDIRRAVEEGAMHVAEGEGEICAAFVLNHLQGEGYSLVAWACEVPAEQVAVIHILATNPKMQGNGIGRKMLNYIRQACTDRGDRVIRLDTLPWNVPGRTMYERFGFAYRGEVELDYACTGKIPFSMYEYLLDQQAGGQGSAI